MTFAQELINFPRNDSGGPFVKVSGVDPTTRYSGKSGNSQLVASSTLTAHFGRVPGHIAPLVNPLFGQKLNKAIPERKSGRGCRKRRA